MAYNMNVSLKYGTHLPCLIQAFVKTKGDILELGTGVFSTPYLHYACTLTKRNLVSYENFPEWYEFMKKYENEYHKVNFVEKYSDAQTDRQPWDIVLIDQTPDSSRAEEASRLSGISKYIIVHDSNPSNYKVTHYDELYQYFRYKTDWMGDNNRATILSNLVDLKDFWL